MPLPPASLHPDMELTRLEMPLSHGSGASVTARIQNIVPDSPAGSIERFDDWGTSSGGLDIISDFEDEAGITASSSNEFLGPSLVMPRMLMVAGSYVSAPIGKLNVLIAGRPGAGKTQLINAIISQSPAILESSGSYEMLTPFLAQQKVATQSADHAEGGRSAARFNISFIETQLSKTLDSSQASMLDFMDSRFHETASLVNGLNPGSMQLLRNSSALGQFPHVDVCLYLFDKELDDEDISMVDLLSKYTAVVPLLCKIDGLTARDILVRKQAAIAQLEKHSVRFFKFEGTNDGLYPIAVSAQYEYNFNMTMSEVMEPGYSSQLLVPSELPELCSQLLCEKGAQQVREFSAHLFAEWVAVSQLRANNLSMPPYSFQNPQQYSIHIPRDLALVQKESSDIALYSGGLNRYPTLAPITNIDPLRLTKWKDVIQVVVVLAAAAFSYPIARKIGKSLVESTPPPPAPTTLAQRLALLLEHASHFVRSILA